MARNIAHFAYFTLVLQRCLGLYFGSKFSFNSFSPSRDYPIELIPLGACLCFLKNVGACEEAHRQHSEQVTKLTIEREIENRKFMEDRNALEERCRRNREEKEKKKKTIEETLLQKCDILEPKIQKKGFRSVHEFCKKKGHQKLKKAIMNDDQKVVEIAVELYKKYANSCLGENNFDKLYPFVAKTTFVNFVKSKETW